ncbi:unnamed protein product, partial [marine sediment metagenome]
RIMPLRWDMEDVSIVTRAYDAEGRELTPCDTLLFERITAHTHAVAKLTLSRQTPAPAWLQHQLYCKGRAVGQFLVPLAATARSPVVPGAKLPPATISPAGGIAQAGPGADLEADAAAKERGFLLWQLHGGPLQPHQPLHVALASGERETLFFGIRSLRPIKRLRASIAAGEQNAEKRLRPLGPTAAYLWSVESGSNGSACLVPFQEQKVPEPATLWIALTFDAS